MTTKIKASNIDTAATDFTFGTMSVDGNLTVTGNLTIEGSTITVDTATVQTVSLGDNDKISLGDSADLQIYHNGTHSFIKDVGTGNLYIDATSLYVRSATGEPYIVGTADAGVSIYYDNALKLATTTTGIDVTGTVTSDSYVHTGDTDTYFHFPAANQLSLVGGGAEIARAYQIAGAYGVLRMNGSGSATYPNFTFNGDDNTGMYRAGTDILAFSTAGAERLRIDSSGNVGIGTTSPASATGFGTGGILHLKGGTGNDCSIVLEGLSGSGGRQEIGVSGGALQFYRGAATGAMTQSMAITSTGNLLVGTSTAYTGAKLSVNGGIVQPSGVQNVIGVFGTSGLQMIGVTGGDNVIGTMGAAEPLVLRTGSTERLRIDSSGNVGIGTSSPTTFSGYITVHHKNTSGDAIYLIESDGGIIGQTFVNDASGVVTTGSRSNHPWRVTTNEVERMRIDTSGGLITKPAAGGHAVFNEDGVDADFRVESDALAHMFFVDASENGVGIGDGSVQPNGLRISSSTGTTSTVDTKLYLNARSSGTTTTGFGPGITFAGDRNGDSVTQQMAQINAVAEVNSGTTLSSGLSFQTATAGVNTEKVRINYNGGFVVTPAAGGHAVFNGNGIDADFRVESATTANALFVEGSSGNVGIGLTSPIDSKLVIVETPANIVSGNAINGSTMKGLKIRTNLNSDESVGVWFGTNGAHWSGISGQRKNAAGTWGTNLSFYTHEDATTDLTYTRERMRIDSSGALLVGQTTGTIFNSSSVTGLTVAGSGSLQVAGSNSTVLYVNRQGTDGQSVGFYKAGVAVGGISVTGSATAYNTSSDYRLKTDAQPMVGASDRVLALNPVNFEWISSGERVDGFLAHEAQAVVPECVTGTKDAMMDEEYEVTAAIEATYDDDGNELTAAVEAVMGTRSVPDMQGIDQSKLVPLLTAALQEALTEISALKARVTALEG